jgi:carbonic anhydrase
MLRILSRFVALSVFSLCLWGVFFAQGADPTALTTHEAIQRLKDGNRRFVENKATHERQQAERRAVIAKKQNPFVIVVCCSDSRVPPEIVFDQGLGDLFVIRTAGNVVDDVCLGSIEYGVEHLGVRLIVVLGHEHCGAVEAAVAGGEAHGHIKAVVNAIRPTVEKVKSQPGNPVENVVRANVSETVKKLSTTAPILPERIKAGKLSIIGARYVLDDGHVEFFKEPKSSETLKSAHP